MRNLKKILALVLALVMSLSLMATAGASSFSDVEAGNQYETAIDVLDALKVFIGYTDGSFQPDGELTRAEAAVLVYRIATGDVEGKYVDNYTYMVNNKFTDLTGYGWAVPYINYCQNAEIVVGTSATTFSPGMKVTGYQLMVMVLRTLGYGKAGEFTGATTWELETAAKCEQLGMLKNVTEGDFGQPAKRAMVAEILFRGLLQETVTYSTFTSGGYTKTGETLGQREFDLNQISGVVTANEWANLTDGEDVLPEGKTELTDADGKKWSMDRTTPITDIGENFAAYLSGSKILTIENTTAKVWEPENGKGTDITTNAKFEKETGLKKNNDTKYFINFEGAYETRSEWQLRYRIPVADVVVGSWLETYLKANAIVSADGVYYVRSFAPETAIPQTDIDIMQGIFYYADRDMPNPDDGTSTIAGLINGEVYAGSSSLKDLSDSKSEGGMTWKAFKAEYLINTNITDVNFSENGDWLKVIDDDGDGVADYIFYTWYYLDEVVSTYKNKAGDTIMQYNWFDDDENPNVRDEAEDLTTIYMGGENNTERAERDVEIGTVVLAAEIDGQRLVSHANDTTETVQKYTFKEDTITTTDGNVYGQSFIGNRTQMQQNLTAMDEKTEYVMYFDAYGYVRAYKLPGDVVYALVTELYYTNAQQGNLKQDWPMTVELTMPDADGKAVKDEYKVTSGADIFTAETPWTLVDNKASTSNYNNWLEPAIAHLGVTGGAVNGEPTKGIPGFGVNAAIATSTWTFWDKNLQIVKTIANNGMAGLQEFNYNTAANPMSSFTNVAIANVDGSNAAIQGAAQRELNRNGGWTGRYDVDYIQLATSDIDAKSVRYAIGGDAAYQNANNYYVNAVHDTQYFIAYNGDVYYVKDYANFPGLTNKDNNIHAAYAVARDTSADNSDKPYWVADVIVYEVESFNDNAKSNISLVYYDHSRTNGQTWLLNTLNNKTENTMIDVVPAGPTWNTFVGWGFYDLYNTSLNEDGTLAARSIDAITTNFSDSGIYAGVLTREVYVANGGTYIDVNLYGRYIDANGNNVKDANEPWVTDASIKLDNNIYSITEDQLPTSGNIYNEAEPLQYSATSWSDVKAGDRIVWVGDTVKGTGVVNADFIVDLSHGENPNTSDHDNTIYYNTAPFLGWHGPVGTGNWNPNPVNPTVNATNVNVTPAGALWRVIWDDQNTYKGGTIDLTFLLTGTETATVTYDGSTGTADATDNTLTLLIPKDAKLFTFEMTLGGGANFNVGFVRTSDWSVASAVEDPGTGVWTVKMLKNDAQTASMLADVADADVVIATTTGWAAYLAEVTAAAATASEAEKAEMAADLKAAKASKWQDMTTAELNALDDAIVALEGEDNAGAQAVAALQTAVDAIEDPLTETVANALVEAIDGYYAAESSMSAAQKTAAADNLATAENAISALADDFNTAYETWAADKTWANVAAAYGKIPEAWEIAAVDAVAGNTELADKVAEVEAAYAEAGTPALTKVELDPYKAAFFGLEITDVDDSVEGQVTVTISMPKGMEPIELDGTENNLNVWFGADGIDTDGELSYTGTPNTFKITGGDQSQVLTVKFDWVDSGVAKYRANMWGANSICVALYDIGAEEWLTASEIEADVTENTSFQFKFAATTLDLKIDKWDTDTATGTIWGDVAVANRGYVKFVPAFTVTDDNPNPITGVKVVADSMSNKIGESATNFSFINNTDLDITYWAATLNP